MVVVVMAAFVMSSLLDDTRDNLFIFKTFYDPSQGTIQEGTFENMESGRECNGDTKPAEEDSALTPKPEGRGIQWCHTVNANQLINRIADFFGILQGSS